MTESPLEVEKQTFVQEHEGVPEFNSHKETCETQNDVSLGITLIFSYLGNKAFHPPPQIFIFAVAGLSTREGP